MPKPCECTGPGICPRIGPVSEFLFRHCQQGHDLIRKVAAHRGREIPEDFDPWPECIYRGDSVGRVVTPVGALPIAECRHPSRSETTPPTCDECPSRSRAEGSTAATVDILLPSIQKGKRVERWAIGVVTAPRKQATLERCLSSMVAAGWESIRIFAEPETDIPEAFRGFPITQRDQVCGAWLNWYLGLQELWGRDPNADAYMIAQDDVIFMPPDGQRSLREFLEGALWPEENPGFVSLYCSKAYNRPTYGWHRLHKAWVWGACAMIFPRESLINFLATSAMDWTRKQKKRQVDTIVGIWAEKKHKGQWFCYPSLAQHIGQTSTIWGKGNTAHGKRASSSFVGDILYGGGDR
jgi:hypothetical protein